MPRGLTRVAQVTSAGSMEQFLDNLGRRLAQLPERSEHYAVAFSGGVDSTVLLTALTRLTPRPAVRALHIDHGLHADSESWEAHCRASAEALGVGYASTRVRVERDTGQSLEAQAREARYGALEGLLAPGEILLTAHHSDDQLETLLLRLLRGSGVKGLRGIAQFDRFGTGFLARPMLDVSRDEILEVARVWQLRWLEDPMNADVRFDRNYLREEILPRIKARWQGAGKTAARAAQQMAQAQEILNDAAEADAALIEDATRVDRSLLLELSSARRRNLLRHLIARLGLPVPSARQLEELLWGLAVERPDARTCVQWPGGEARIYRDCLYLFSPIGEGSPDGYSGEISEAHPWSGPEGSLRLVRAPGPGLPDGWAKMGLTVRFRVGGERFKPLRENHSRPLKKWLQDAGVAPWMRGRIPMLYRSDELVAVGDLWITAAVDALPDTGPQWRVEWTDHPPLA